MRRAPKLLGAFIAFAATGALSALVSCGGARTSATSGAAASKPRVVVKATPAEEVPTEPYAGKMIHVIVALCETGARPLLWTTNLMAPETYVLSAAVDGWLAGDDGEGVRLRAAKAYHSYQKCGLKAAHKLFASGW